MKMIIYKAVRGYCVTNERNYNAVIQNAREIHQMQDFDSAEEIIEYFCTYFGSKAEDFIKAADYQPKKIDFEAFTPSWYIYTTDEGIPCSRTFDGDVEANQFFTDVSYRISFDDCSGETVHKIYYKGKEVEYVGWQPGMRFEYKDLDGNTVWVGVFEHWDH